jgi:heat shock protein HtpX
MSLSARLRPWGSALGLASLFPLATGLGAAQIAAPRLADAPALGLGVIALGAGLGLGALIASMRAADAAIRARPGYRALPRAEAPDLYAVTDALAARAGMKPPRLAALDQDERNAFVFGGTASSATLVVTRGLLESLNRSEFEIVVAHELAHVRHGDAMLNAVARACVQAASRIDAATRFALAPLARRLPKLTRRMGSGASLSRFASNAVLRLLSPEREGHADRAAAALIGALAPMHAAMSKIAETGALAESDPFISAMAFAGSLRTQPSLEARLRALFAPEPVAAPTPPRRAGFWSLSAGRTPFATRIAAGAMAMLAISATGVMVLRRAHVDRAGVQQAQTPNAPAPSDPRYASAPAPSPAAPDASSPGAALGGAAGSMSTAGSGATGSLGAVRATPAPVVQPVTPARPAPTARRSPETPASGATPQVRPAARSPSATATARTPDRAAIKPLPPRRPDLAPRGEPPRG